MNARYVRHEWVDAPRVLPVPVDDAATIETFAFEHTAVVLDVEPALAVLASLVERARPTQHEWRGVERIAATLVGPRRSVVQTTAVDARYVAVRATLNGDTTYQRYLEALRGLVA